MISVVESFADASGAALTRRRQLLVLSALAVTAAGCATSTSGPASAPWPAPPPRPGAAPGTPGAAAAAPPGAPLPPAGTVTPPAPGAAPLPSPIAAERRWLEEWFEKTPVVIRQLGDSVLQLSVPMANSFEAGQSQPRPALVAVLDRLAESLRRQANTRLTVITAGDANSPPALATARGQKVLDHLVSRRIAPQRVTPQRADAPGTPVLLQLQFGVLPAL